MTAHQRTILKSSSTARKANSANSTQFKSASENVKIATEYQFKNIAWARKGLCLEFTSSASGGSGDSPGKTDFRIHIGVNDYTAILKAMAEVDREATLLAVAEVLVEYHAAAKEKRDAAAKEKQDAARQRNAEKLASISIPRP